MNKKLKFTALLIAGVLAFYSLEGCGNSGASGSKTSKNIIVWSHLTDAEVKEITPIAQEWAKSTGNTVKVISDKGEYLAFLQAANSSKRPDVMFGVPNDNLGTFKQAGLLAEVPSTVLDKSKYSEVAVKAVTLNGKKYAVPLSTETTALFYNTDKIKTAPKTYEELIEQAKTNGFKYEVNNIYYSFPFLAANGGYFFKDKNGTLNPDDIGIGNAGSVKGYEMIQDLVQKDKLMSSDIKGDIALGEFQAGKTAFYISGAWDVDTLKKANVKFTVTPMPTIDGKAMSTLVRVQTGFVNAKSKNQTEAMDLLKYLANHTSSILFKTGNRIPAITAEATKVSTDANVKAFVDQVKVSIPMPNIKETASVWKMNDSLNLLTSGKLTPEQYAEKALTDMKAAIAVQK